MLTEQHPAAERNSAWSLDGAALRAWLPTLLWIAAAVAIFLCFWLAPVPRELVGLAAYLPLHTAMETFSVVVAVMVFSVGWASQRTEQPQNVLLLCYAFLAVGLLDFAHLVSYEGMPGFSSPGTSSKAINYWLMARMSAALALLIAVLWPARPLRTPWVRYALPAAEIVVAALAIAVVEYREHWLPTPFVPGKGLTLYKIQAEYAIIGVQVAAVMAVLLRRRAFNLDPQRLVTALAVLSLGELCFTLYVQVSDLFNVLGHVYKVIGYYLLYRVVFVDAVQRPFEDLRRSQEALRESERRYAELVEQSPDAMIVLSPAGSIEAVNPAYERLVGRPAGELIGSRRGHDDSLAPESVARVGEEFALVLAGKERSPVEIELRRSDGESVHVEAKARALRRGAAIAGVQVVMRDITERKRAERQLNYLAYHDLLTGLPNRVLLAERVQDAIEEAQRHGRLVAVLFIDLDRFKYINDSLGHSVGDTLLQAAADRFRTMLRPGDTVARHGGDEFIVILADVAHADDVTRVAERMLAGFTSPFLIGDRELYITPSIGISFYPLDDSNPENLFKNADAAMYNAKDSGRNTFRFFTAEMNTRARRRLMIETDLRRAVPNGELFLHYQPIMRVNGGDIVGLEALLRWRHPESGLIGPGEFIAVAEESGLINAIGVWVAQEGCRRLAQLRASGHVDLTLAINVSSRQFQARGLSAVIQRALDEAGLPPECLELEITESMLMQETEEVAATLRELDRIGVRLSLDDFGTGYSSLAYLRRLPISRVKIDRSFVKDLTTDPDDATIAQTIIAMAHSLGMEVVAEGVETPAQLDLLRRYGCDAAQGYYLGKPMPLEECTALLLHHRRSAGAGS